MEPQYSERLDERERKVPVFTPEDEAKLESINTLQRGEPMGWGATPLNPYLPEIMAQQQAVESVMDALFTEDLPDDVPLEYAEAIHQVYMGRREHRRIRNYESFKHRGVQDLRSGPAELVEMADRAISGHASPAEIHLVGKYYEIPTRALGDVSVALGKRIDDDNGLRGLRKAVDECIAVHNGVVLDSPPVYQIQGFEMTDIRSSHGRTTIPRLRMTRSLDKAVIDESCLVVERSSFDVRLDALFGFQPEVAAELLRVYQSGQSVSEDDVLAIEAFRPTITALLNDNRFDIARPVSVTAFEVDVDLCEKYLDNKDFRKAIAMRERLKNDSTDGTVLRQMIDEIIHSQEADNTAVQN